MSPDTAAELVPLQGESKSRPCPYCGETILEIAKKCRFCNEWIDQTAESLTKESICNALCQARFTVVELPDGPKIASATFVDNQHVLVAARSGRRTVLRVWQIGSRVKRDAPRGERKPQRRVVAAARG